MKASKARNLTNAAVKKMELESEDTIEFWNILCRRIIFACERGLATLDVPKADVTPAIKKKLISNGYRVNGCFGLGKEEHKNFSSHVQISW